MNPEELGNLLAQHEHVAQALVAAERDSRDPRRTAYVVPRGTTGDEEDRQEKRVEEWQQIYDRLYTNAPTTAFGDNFAGWVSSYDRRPIDPEQMRLWRSSTVERIRDLQPSRILEIGVGNGLLLSQLAAECESYWGTDLSPAAVEDVGRQVEQDPALANRVVLRSQAADNTAGLPAEHFDTVVINSVVQLFPDGAYLAEVIRGALGLLAPGGALFLGDIRDRRTPEYLHTAVALRRGTAKDADAVLRSVRKSLSREEELFVHPDHFLVLKDAEPEITAAEVWLKRGDYHNELSRHRYDVVLRKGTPPGTEITDVTDSPAVRWGEDLADTAELRTRVETTSPPLRVTGIPNARLAGEAAAWRAVSAGDLARATRLLDDSHPAMDPHAIDELAAECGRSVRLAPSPEAPELFEAVFTTPGEKTTGTYRTARTAPPYTEVPAVTRRNEALVERLRSWLRERLPEHEIPEGITVLDTLPSHTDDDPDHDSPDGSPTASRGAR
ncbi:class I SAM-dependent methyltransferase [Actinopolyspora saharensis]|uniref:Ubiquinone/menaquinone biosynthesis C-methylase UbiE n=1 Tax=Actinopolyspora saharensis TaxID=995062 RepID=A0A1H1FBY0_9ACTN|nr:class I SAM-dependent methyltransferase [Actinopolyspora saharensis]SDQ98239.1 Ubiquinone/menaquinone biosynthesis C-methylase UbiE [Actinopolyspora saharensis]